MAAKRQKKPADRKTFEVALPVRMGWFTTFYYADCTVSGDDDSELGAISGGLGGVIGVRHKPSGRECFIWPEDLWNALIPALTGLTGDEYEDGWEPVPEPTAADLERANAVRAKAKLKAERRGSYQARGRAMSARASGKDFASSEWGRYSTAEASDLEGVIFRPETGVGFEYKDDFAEWTAAARGSERGVRLVTSSFVGAIGAIHYYAHLKIDNLSMGGGSMSGPRIPPTVSGLEIRIEKKVTRTMLERPDGTDWTGYRVGDWTYRFDTEAGAAKAARAFFEQRFRGGWEITEDRITS